MGTTSQRPGQSPVARDSLIHKYQYLVLCVYQPTEAGGVLRESVYARKCSDSIYKA
jgi:hypothetical protein